MTDERIIEILATKGMGWTKVQIDYGFQWEDKAAKLYSVRSFTWNPLTDRNAVAEVEARLTTDQKHKYLAAIYNILMEDEENSRGLWNEWEYRHASPRTCAEALARVLAPEAE